MVYQKVILMGYAIQDYLVKHSLKDAKPKDLMPVLIEKGFSIKTIVMGCL